MTKSYRILFKEIRGEFRCSKCGAQITVSSKSGLCRSCGQKLANRKGKVKNCRSCNKKISSRNSTGLCADCLRKRQRKYYNYAYGTTKKKSRQKMGQKGKCRLCKKEFDLESWQHSSLHWCPDCRKLGVYQDYYSNQKVTERFNREIKKGYQTSTQAILRERGRN